MEREVTVKGKKNSCISPWKPEKHLLSMLSKKDITRDWLPRYTGTEIEEFGDYILLTNFDNYVTKFSERFEMPIRGEGGPM